MDDTQRIRLRLADDLERQVRLLNSEMIAYSDQFTDWQSKEIKSLVLAMMRLNRSLRAM